MKRQGEVRSRRQLFRAMIAGAASLPLIALAGKSARADDWNNGGGPPPDDHRHDDGARCLLKGTKVSIPSGERLVEDLQIGDDVLTLSGPKAIKWIGYDKYTKDADRPWQVRVMPVRVARSALADQAPHRDLYLSPLHCVLVNGALIPVKYLVNGTTIAPAAPAGMDVIEYYHIEFETHEVLLAEGAPVESFIEEDSEREYFSNFVQYERLYGRERQTWMTPFAPILGYRNRRQKAAGLARSIVSNVVDVRDPIQVARDQLAKRAQTQRAEALAV
jgi:hypothetical protein